MAIVKSPNDIADTLSAPLGELIAAVGRGVAEAQQALDEGTVETLRRVYREKDSLLVQLGYQPTWYRIPEVNAEISISLSIAGEVDARGAAGAQGGLRASKIKLYAAPVDASYTNMYNYDFKAASVIKFKIVPVPPSPEAANLRVVPVVANKTYGAVKALLDGLGIPFRLGTPQAHEPSDNTTVKDSLPVAGDILRPGQHVELEI